MGSNDDEDEESEVDKDFRRDAQKGKCEMRCWRMEKLRKKTTRLTQAFFSSKLISLICFLFCIT